MTQFALTHVDDTFLTEEAAVWRTLSDLMRRHLPALASAWAVRLHAADGTCYPDLQLETIQETGHQVLRAGLIALRKSDRGSPEDFGRRLARLRWPMGFTLRDIRPGYRLLRELLLALIDEQPWDAALRDRARQVCLTWIEEAAMAMLVAFQRLTWQNEQLQAAQLERLNHLAAALSHSLSLDTVLQTAMETACDLTGAEWCWIHLPDEERQTLRLKTSLNSPPDLDDKLSSRPISGSLEGQAFSLGQLMTFEKQQNVEAAREGKKSPQTFACLPLSSKGQSHGVLSLGFSREDRFDREERALLSAIGHQVGMAIENAQFYEQERHQRQIAEMLGEVARVINSTLELSEVLDWVLVELEKVVSYDSTSIMLLEGENVHIAAARGFADHEAVMAFVLRLSDLPLTQKVIRQRQPLIIPDTRQEPLFDPSIPGSAPIRSVIAFPLISRDEVIGALNVDSWTPHRYSAQDVELVCRFAQYAAVAIANARRHAELEQKVQQRAQEICRQRDRTAAILQSVADGVVVTDLEGNIISTNPVADLWLYHGEGDEWIENQILMCFIRHLATRPPGEGAGVVEFMAWEQQLEEPCWQMTNCDHQDCPAYGREAPPCWRISTAHCHFAWDSPLERFAAERLYDCPIGDRLERVSLQAQVAELEEGGEVQGLVIVLRDISRLWALDRLKSQFVSTVSHELRTPLANIKLYHNLLQQGRDDRQELYMEIMGSEIVRLERLIEDLLDLSRLEIRDRPTRREIVDLNLLLRELIQIHALQAQTKGLSLHLEEGPETLRVYADRNQLFQVFTNLLVNALNYTSEGGQIWLTSGVWHLQGEEWEEAGTVPHPRPSVARPPDGEWAVVSVRDTGIGILPEDFPYIFDRFFRGSQAVLKTPGTGLGLPIVREILDLHGGHIQAESQLDVGSNFTVLLPLPQPEKERKITVLVADDEEQIGQVIHRFLSREGIKVQWVPNGHQALEAIAADPPELLILDLTMPVMDGYQVLEKLQVEGGGASLPVLVLSSWTEDKFQRIKRLGAVDFLNKPFSGTVLVDVVKRLIALSG